MKKHKAFSLIELSIVIVIIGIIIAGVTQGSRLVKQMKLSSARTQTQSSPISSIKNLELWLESTSEKSFDDAETEDGATVTTWYDINPQSSVKNNATQATDANKPIYVSSAINGLPALSGNGTSTVLESTLTDSFVSSGFTWIGVLQWINPNTGDPRGYFGLKSKTGAGANSGVTLFLDDGNAGGGIRIFSPSDGVLSGSTIQDGSINQYQPHIITIVRTTTSLALYDNGVQVGSTVADSGTDGIYD